MDQKKAEKTEEDFKISLPAEILERFEEFSKLIGLIEPKLASRYEKIGKIKVAELFIHLEFEKENESTESTDFASPLILNEYNAFVYTENNHDCISIENDDIRLLLEPECDEGKCLFQKGIDILHSKCPKDSKGNLLCDYVPEKLDVPGKFMFTEYEELKKNDKKAGTNKSTKEKPNTYNFYKKEYNIVKLESDNPNKNCVECDFNGKKCPRDSDQLLFCQSIPSMLRLEGNYIFKAKKQ